MRYVDTIKHKVSVYYEINSVHMVDHRRTRRFSRPRQIAMFLCRKHTDMSFPDIGAEFGKDHTTVIHAVRNIEALIQARPEIRDDVKIIEAMLPWLQPT